MSFKPIQKLMVTRMLSSGEQVAVGVLTQNSEHYPPKGLQIVTFEVTLCRPLTAEFPRSVKYTDEYSAWISHFYAQKGAEFYIFMRVKV